MKIEIEYFGQASEAVGKTKTEVSLNDKLTLELLMQSVLKEHSSLSKMNLKWAVNQRFENGDFILNEGDKIAVLPPFAGG